MFSASSASAIRLLTKTSVGINPRAPVSRGLANLSVARNTRQKFVGTGRFVFGTVLLASFVLATTRVYTDVQTEASNVVSRCGIGNAVGFVDYDFLVVDPSTSITFPKTMHIPFRVPIPDLSLIGVGVRTVSFLGIKVYSVAFYADLNNPMLQVPSCFSSQFTPCSPMDRYPSQPPPKIKSTISSKTRHVLSGSSLREIRHIVISATVS